MNNIELAQLLTEAAELLNEDNDTLNEGVESLIPIGMMLAYFLSLTSIVYFADKKEIKERAKTAKAVTREEIHNGITYLNSINDKITALFKQSKYKDFLDKDILRLNSNHKDISGSRSIKHKPFAPSYALFSVNLLNISKNQKKYEEVVVTSDRLSDYIKKELEDVAKVCDKVRNIVYANKFMKDNFVIALYPNESSSILTCVLAPKTELILTTSKYIETK